MCKIGAVSPSEGNDIVDLAEAATKTLEEEAEDLRSWITSFNIDAIDKEDVSGTHDDKSHPRQVEVEIKQKLKRKKKKSAKDKNEEPLNFQDIITLDAPSNAAVEKVKKRKKDRRRSYGPELGTYPVRSICKGIDNMRSTGAVPLPGGGFNPIPEHAPEEEPEFYGRDPQPVKFVSAEYKRKRGDDSSSSSESSVNEEEKDIVPAPPATIKKKKRKRKRSGALVQDVLPMAENSDFADMDSISTHKRKKKGKRKHAITVKEGIAVHTSASVKAVPDTTDKAEITSSSTVGDQHGAIGRPEEKAEVLGTNDGCNGNDNRDSGPQPKIVTRDGLWEMKLNRSLGPGEGFVRIKKDIPFSKKKNRNKQPKNWSIAMKRHWNTPEKDKAMAKITIRRRDMHLVRFLLTMFSTDRVRFDFQCYFIIGLSQNVFGRRLYNRGLF